MKVFLPAAVLALLLVPAAAQALPYVGMDVGVASVDFKTFATTTTTNPVRQSVNGFNLHVGERFGRFAVELGYGSTSSGATQALNSLRLNKITGDGLFYMPIMGGLNAVFTGGMAETNFGSSAFNTVYFTNSKGDNKSQRQDITIFHGNEFNWRGGGGLAFSLGDSVEVRTIGRYEPVTLGGRANYNLTLDLGLNVYL